MPVPSVSLPTVSGTSVIPVPRGDHPSPLHPYQPDLYAAGVPDVMRWRLFLLACYVVLRAGVSGSLREDGPLFLYVLCYDNKNEAAGIPCTFTEENLFAKYAPAVNSDAVKMLPGEGAVKEVSTEQIYRQLSELVRRYGTQQLVLFVSRARGDSQKRSDIDLAVYRMPPENRTSFWLEAAELPTLLELDIVHVILGMGPQFLSNIEGNGVAIHAAES